jgi:putative ABC transport system ATP-binding protein
VTRPDAGTAAEPLVLLERVWKRYGEGGTEVAALRDASLEIPHGEFVVFLGPSGSGKTTLLNIIGGLDRPTSGRVIVAGYDLAALDDAGLTAYRRDVIGFVFQFFNLVPTLTARENVELVAGLVPDPLDAGKVLAAVGLADREEHFPSALSGGEQQRVAIARALVKAPLVVLADEPTGNLDFDTGIRVLKVLRELPRSLGRSVLLVTHNQEITRMADRVVRIHSGSIAEVSVNPAPVAAEELRW